MKKFIVALLFLASQVVFAKSWDCYRYVDGKPTGGFVKVQADSKKEAEKKSEKKYKKLGYSLDYTECKIHW